jgi:hypothetical protein
MPNLGNEPIETRTIIKTVGLIILIGLIISYILFQARFLIIGPKIVLEAEPATQQNNRTVTLSGNAYNITRLWLNDRRIYTDENGYFKEVLVLENGYTIATLKATDRYGRETRVVRSYVYTPASIIKNNE